MEESKNRLKNTKQVVIDIEYHRQAKIKAINAGIPLKTYLEALIIDDLVTETSGN